MTIEVPPEWQASAPDQQLVAFGHEGFQHADLAGHLGASDNGSKGPKGGANCLAQEVKLLQNGRSQFLIYHEKCTESNFWTRVVTSVWTYRSHCMQRQ